MVVLSQVLRRSPSAHLLLRRLLSETSSGETRISDRIKSGVASVRTRVTGMSEESLERTSKKLSESRAAGKTLGEATSEVLAVHRRAKLDEDYITFRDSLMQVTNCV